MNALFVNIKVDREERPDIDGIYQSALALMGERGGWPLTMFLTPEGEPFWGGTYFPPSAPLRPARLPAAAARHRRGLPLGQDQGRHQRHGAARGIGEDAGARARQRPQRRGPGRGRALRSAPDRHPSRRHRRRAEVSAADLLPLPLAGLQAPRRGRVPRRGDGDAGRHLPGRHLRPPRRRLRPLLHRRRLAGAALREDALRQRPARRADDGGLAGDAQPALRQAHRRDDRLGDARDARRRPGADELSPSPARSTPTARASRASTTSGTRPRSTPSSAPMRPRFKAAYDVRPGGNWEGHTILNRTGMGLPADDEERRLADCRARLLAVRRERIRAGARRQGAGRLERADDRGAGRGRRGLRPSRSGSRRRRSVFRFVTTHMSEGGRLKHVWRAGQARHPAVLEDYANMAQGGARPLPGHGGAVLPGPGDRLVRGRRPAFPRRCGRRLLRLRRRHHRRHRAGRSRSPTTPCRPATAPWSRSWPCSTSPPARPTTGSGRSDRCGSSPGPTRSTC